MSNYKLNNPEEKKIKPSPKRIIGIILVVLCSIAFLSLFTGILGFMKLFLLGIMGLFVYPFFIITFIIGIALINNKKYTMSKRYVISLSLAVFSILSLIDLGLMHNFSGNYGEWLAYSYTHKLTAGGFIVGFFTAPFRYLLFEAGAFVIFSLLLIVSIGLIIDYFRFAKNYKNYKKPVKIAKETAIDNTPVEVLMNNKKRKSIEDNIEPAKITLDAEIEKNKQELTAKEKLGLLKKSTIVSNNLNVFDSVPPIAKKMTDTEKVAQGKMSIRDYLLSKPTNIDMGYYNRDFTQNKKIESVDQTINSIKNEVEPLKQNTTQLIKPEKIVHDDFGDFSNNSFSFNPTNQNTNVFENNIQPAPQIEDTNKTDEINPYDEEVSVIDKLENEVLQSLNNPNVNIDINAPTVTPNEGRRRERFVNLNPTPTSEQTKLDLNQTKQESVAPISPKISKPKIYKIPPMEIFTTESVNLEELNEDMTAKKAQLEYALETFNVPAKVIAVTIGPAVTRFELEMPVGISVKKLVAHSDDIALTLAANGGIRIEAPIPGKSAVGIEVPNDKIATVGLKEVFTAKEFTNAKSPLTVALGKDISGEIKVCDIAKMPHLLVAGATNSGKSVCLNAIILSLVSKNSPEDLKLILIDPKRVEFTMYNDLPHLVMPKVITETDKAINALNYCVTEMERRFVLLQEKRCRNIAEYNESEDVALGKCGKLPFLVIIVDELADLMVMAKKEVEEKILRLAQKARAAGIHMVLATQRPSVDVITGLIKANFPSRISFALTSFADSKTILDQGGAEKLLGKGDMLYLPSDAPCPKRIQGCFMTGTEVYNYVEFLKDNNDFEFDAEVEHSITAPKQSNINELLDGKRENDFDELMPQALRLVIENGQASITILQRKLLIGYPRASRIVDQMETAGYISPSDGSKPRSVYMTMEEWEKKFKKDEE